MSNQTDPSISAAIARAKERRRFSSESEAQPMSAHTQAAPAPAPQPAPPAPQPAPQPAPPPPAPAPAPVVNTVEMRGVQVAPPAPATPEMSTLEKIGLLGSFANACKDEDIIDVLLNRPNGERLYEVFVSAVSREIEGIMNGPAANQPRALQDASVSANNLAGLLARFVQVFNAIEQGPGLAIFRMFVEQLGTRLPPIPTQVPAGEAPPQQPQRQYVQPPQQQTTPTQPVAHAPVATRQREPRGDNAGGSW